MGNETYLSLKHDLEALARREVEAIAEHSAATRRRESVRVRALASELQRIARRRGEILLAIPRHEPLDRVAGADGR